MIEKLIGLLSDYFNIGDSYHYTLGRSKEAFGMGTMSLYDFTEYGEDDAADLAEFLMENGVTVQRWIPVTERLPKVEDANSFGEIMVWLRRTETQALWKWRRAIDHPEAISHWMPLPKPPKEVE